MTHPINRAVSIEDAKTFFITQIYNGLAPENTLVHPQLDDIMFSINVDHNYGNYYYLTEWNQVASQVYQPVSIWSFKNGQVLNVIVKQLKQAVHHKQLDHILNSKVVHQQTFGVIDELDVWPELQTLIFDK